METSGIEHEYTENNREESNIHNYKFLFQVFRFYDFDYILQWALRTYILKLNHVDFEIL